MEIIPQVTAALDVQTGLFLREMNDLFFYCIVLAFAKESRDKIIKTNGQFIID